MYVYSIGLGGSYGNKFKPAKLHELVHFERVVVMDGVRGSSVGEHGVDDCSDDRR